MRGGPSDGKRRDMAASPGPHSVATPTVHSPISDIDEPAPGAEINPGTSPGDDNIQPDFLENGAPTGDETPKSALDADIDRDADSLNDLADQEKNASAGDGQDGAQNSEESKLNDDDESKDDGFYKKGGARTSLRGRITSTRGRATMAIGGAIISGIAGILTILPGATITTVSDLMTKVGEVQVDHQYRYHRKWSYKVKDLFSKEGRRGTRIISNMERRGYRFQYDPTGRNVTGIAKPNSRVFITNADEIGATFAEGMNTRIPLRSGRWKDPTATALYNKFGVKRNSITSAPRDPNKSPKQQINQEFREAGANQEIKVNSRANIDPDADQATQDQQQTQHDTDKNLVDRQGEFADIAEQLDEGIDIDDIDADPLKIASFKEGGVPGSASIAHAAAVDASGSGISAGLEAAQGIISTGDWAARICTINRAIAAGMIVAREVRAYNMYLSAFRFATASDGIKKQEAGADLVREVGKRITSPDALGAFIGTSAGMSSVLNGGFSKSRNDAASSGYSVSADIKGWELETYKQTDLFGTCDLWLNGYTQLGLTAADVGLTIFSFGGWRATREVTEEAGQRAFQEGLKASISRAIKSRTGKSVATTGLIEASFTTLSIMLKLRVEKMMAGEITGQERGGAFGDIMFGGMGVANKQRSLRAGLVPTRAKDYAVAYDKYLAEKKDEMKNKSIFARYLDFSDTDSLAFRVKTVAVLGAGAPVNSVGNIINETINSPKNFASTITGLFTGKTSAQVSDPDFITYDTYEFKNGNYEGEEIAVDFAGNMLTTMRDDIAAIDPEINETELIASGDIDPETKEPMSEQFKNHIEECVDAMDTISVLEQDASDWTGGTDPSQDCFAEQEITKKFKAHLAWLDLGGTATAHGDPESLNVNIGPGNTQTPAAGTPNAPINAEGLNGYTIPCEGTPRPVIRVGADSANWSGIPDSGTIGLDSAGQPIKVYIRDACAGAQNIKTVVIVGSVHGSENGGQLVAHELLFNEDIPDNIRIVAIPEYCSCAGTGLRGNENGVDLNRNNAYNWSTLPQTETYETGLTWSKGSAPASEPETQAMNKFLQSLGRADLSLHYHDSLNYVAPVGSTNALLARQYADATSMRVGNDGGVIVTQRGSLDAWYNQELGTPAVLVEMGPSQNDGVIDRHVRGVLAILNGGSL